MLQQFENLGIRVKLVAAFLVVAVFAGIPGVVEFAQGEAGKQATPAEEQSATTGEITEHIHRITQRPFSCSAGGERALLAGAGACGDKAGQIMFRERFAQVIPLDIITATIL